MNQISKNMIWNTISIIVTSLISLTLTPYVTEHIGIEATGFISLSNTIVSYIDIIVIALNAFASRNIAIAYHNGNEKEVNSYYNSIIIANIFLTLAINCVCIYTTIHLQNILNISDVLINDVKILFLLMILNYTVNIFGSIFSISAFIKNRSSITYRNKGISSLLYAVSLGGLIYFTSIHVYYVAIGYLVAAIFNLISNYYYTRKLLPEVKFDIHFYSFDKIRKLVSSGIWNSINNIGVLLNTGLDLLIANKMLSGIVMGQISVSKQISTIMTTVTGIVVNGFQPKQLEKYAKGDIAGLIDYLRISVKLSSILTITLFSCFFVLGKSFLLLWLPNQDTNYIYVLCVIVIFGDIVVATVRPLYYVFTLTNNLRITCFFTILSGVINSISMIVLITFTDLGGYVIVGTTCVLNFITNIIITPYLAGKFLNLKHNPFYPIIIKHVIVCFVITFILYVINWSFVISSWLSFIVGGFVTALIAILLSVLLMTTKKEKQLMLNKLKR